MFPTRSRSAARPKTLTCISRSGGRSPIRSGGREPRNRGRLKSFVIASEAKQSSEGYDTLDCRVASLLAMTRQEIRRLLRDRKRGWQGKSVPGRVDLGGRHTLTKNK